MIPINHQPELKMIYYNIITDHNRCDALQAEADTISSNST